MAQTEYRISYADLSRIANELSQIEAATKEMGSAINVLGRQQAVIDDKLESLGREFSEFVALDAKHKQVQLAETRLVKVRQDLEQQFGFYAEVRRSATGLLQAIDADIVSLDTIRDTTEEMMIKATGYWLAPILVALSGWIRDDKSLVEKAVREALQRDDYKTSLFFTLVSRRLNRPQGGMAWMERYFAHQDPEGLDREFVLILDAIANGLFTPSAQGLAIKNIEGWLAQFGEQAEFAQEQQSRWEAALMRLAPGLPDDAFPVLREYSPTWPQLEQSLVQAGRYEKSSEHFQNIFSGEIPLSQKISQDLDLMLNGLVTEFDDEELPLKKQERRLQLIIEADGDQEQAESRMTEEEKSFEEEVAFTNLLTNAALMPEQSGTNLATQRFAIAISRDWILSAHETLTARARAEHPQEIEISIDSWSAKTRDGSNEAELLQEQQTEYENRTKAALDSVKLNMGVMIGAAVAGIAGVWLSIEVHLLGLLVLAGGMGLIPYHLSQLKKKRAQIQRDFEQRLKNTAEILRALLAEGVDYRSQWTEKDAAAETFRQTLVELTPAQYQRSRPEDIRTVIA